MNKIFILLLLLFFSKQICFSQCITPGPEGCGNGGYTWQFTGTNNGSISFTSLTPAGAWFVSYDNGVTWFVLTAPSTVSNTGPIWVLAIDPNPADFFVFSQGSWNHSLCSGGTNNYSGGHDCFLDMCSPCGTPPPACTPATITLDSIVDETCPGASNGGIYTTVTGPSTYTITWNIAGSGSDQTGLSSGSYSITATDNLDPTCVVTQTYNVGAGTGPNVTANTSNDSICIGQSVTLFGQGAVSYSWDNSVTDNQAFSPTTTQTYTVTGTDAGGCTATDNVIVVVESCITPIAALSVNNQTICEGQCINFTDNSLNMPAGALISWLFPGSDTPTSTAASPNVCYQNQGTYLASIIYTDASLNFLDSASLFITVDTCGNPIANFTYTFEPYCEGVLVDYVNLSTGAVSYSWTIDQMNTNVFDTAVIGAYDSKFNVTLVAISGAFSDQVTKEVVIPKLKDMGVIIIPNIFSPNADTENDQFKVIFPEQLKECSKLAIYNRWGNIMYETNSNAFTWDGRTESGQEVPEGTYFVVFEVANEQCVGYIQLVR